MTIATGSGAGDTGGRHGAQPTVVPRYSGDTQAERTAFWAEVVRDGARDLERRAREGDARALERPWVRERIVDWWMPEIEHLKRTDQLVLALELAWECLTAIEGKYFDIESAGAVDPWFDTRWGWEAAVIARKLRNYDAEIEVINRMLDVDAFPSDNLRLKWEARLEKAEALKAKAAG